LSAFADAPERYREFFNTYLEEIENTIVQDTLTGQASERLGGHGLRCGCVQLPRGSLVPI